MAKYDLGKMSSLLGNVQDGEHDPQFLRPGDLIPFSQHPFRKYSASKMADMVESVRQNGIMSPLLVREAVGKKEKFEIIAGHNRLEAAKQVGLREVPVLIRDLDDEAAIIMMVDSNFNQRDEILPSEKAFAYKMKLDAIKRRTGRPEKNASHCVTDKRSDQIVADEAGENRMTLQRYIRLTELIPELLAKVDNNQMGFIPAVDISYLDKQQQHIVCELIELTNLKPSKAQAAELKKRFKAGELDDDGIYEILDEQEKKWFSSISAKQFRTLLPSSLQKRMTQERATAILNEAMALWREKYKNKYPDGMNADNEI